MERRLLPWTRSLFISERRNLRRTSQPGIKGRPRNLLLRLGKGVLRRRVEERRKTWLWGLQQRGRRVRRPVAERNQGGEWPSPEQNHQRLLCRGVQKQQKVWKRKNDLWRRKCLFRKFRGGRSSRVGAARIRKQGYLQGRIQGGEERGKRSLLFQRRYSFRGYLEQQPEGLRRAHSVQRRHLHWDLPKQRKV